MNPKTENSRLNNLWARFERFKMMRSLDMQYETLLDILREQPGNIDACNEMARIAESRGQMELAGTFLRQASAAAGDQSPQVHYNLARILRQQKKFLQAQAVLLQAHQIQSGHPAYLLELGLNSWQLGEKALAIECFTKRLELVNKCTASLYHLGLDQMDQKNFSRAREYFKKIVYAEYAGIHEGYLFQTRLQIIRSFLYDDRADRADDNIKNAGDNNMNTPLIYWQTILDCLTHDKPLNDRDYRKFIARVETLLLRERECAGQLLDEVRRIAEHVVASRPAPVTKVPSTKPIAPVATTPTKPQTAEPRLPANDRPYFDYPTSDSPEEYVDQNFIFIHQSAYKGFDSVLEDVETQVALRTSAETARTVKSNVISTNSPSSLKEPVLYLRDMKTGAFQFAAAGETSIRGPGAQNFYVIIRTVIELNPIPPLWYYETKLPIVALFFVQGSIRGSLKVQAKIIGKLANLCRYLPFITQMEAAASADEMRKLLLSFTRRSDCETTD